MSPLYIFHDIEKIKDIDKNIFDYCIACQNQLNYPSYKIYYFTLNDDKYFISLHFRLGAKLAADGKRGPVHWKDATPDELVFYSSIRESMLENGLICYNDQCVIDYFKFFANGDLREEELILSENLKPELIVVYLAHRADNSLFTSFGCSDKRYEKLLERVKTDAASCIAFSKYILKNKRWYESEDIIKQNKDLYNFYLNQVGEQ